MPLPMPVFLMPQAMPANLALLEFVFHRFQRRFGAGARFDNLTGRGHIAIIKGVLVTELPAVKAALLAEIINAAFQARMPSG